LGPPFTCPLTASGCPNRSLLCHVAQDRSLVG
jgi:hypothetical protein